MKVNAKLAALELIEGACGWVWLLSCLAALVLIVQAIWFEGSWGMVLIAVITGAIGKWLSQGFRDTKKRVAFEAALIAKGFSPQETGRMWLEAYSKT